MNIKQNAIVILIEHLTVNSKLTHPGPRHSFPGVSCSRYGTSTDGHKWPLSQSCLVIRFISGHSEKLVFQVRCYQVW